VQTENKRLMLSLTPELWTKLDTLKKESFYNCSWAEMLRFVLALGLESMQQQKPICGFIDQTPKTKPEAKKY